MRAGDLVYCKTTGELCLVIRRSKDSISFWKILRQGRDVIVNERYLEKINASR